MPVTTRSKLRELDRVIVAGTITRLAAQPEGRFSMTVDVGHTAPITLDAMWSNSKVESLIEGDTVNLGGRIERINHSSEPKWTTASLKLDGYAYRVTLLLSELRKA